METRLAFCGCRFLGMKVAALPVALALLSSPPLHARQTVIEPGWALLRNLPFNSPVSARLHPLDGRVYVGRRGTSTDGLYRLDVFGAATQLAAGSNTAALLIDPATGHIFQSEDFGGVIYRTEFGSTGRITWVSGFHAGDDDPIGMAIAPPGYVGGVISPGEALVVDRGFNGPDEIWRWSTATPEGELLLHADNGTLIDAVDIAISLDGIYVADTGEGAPGIIRIVGSGGSLTTLVTSEPVGAPSAVSIDPRNGDLLVGDRAGGRVVRIDPAIGTLTTVITGLGADLGWAAVEASSDGVHLIITVASTNSILIYGRCAFEGPSELDCDGNGIADSCDIALGSGTDCNGNGILDACDIALGTSFDCNGDGLPDECVTCPPVEVVFIMDTSTSMNNEAETLCATLPQIASALGAAGLEVESTLLAICNLPGGGYSCLQNHIIALLGNAVPGDPPAGLAVLGACPGGIEGCNEDWGRAVAVVAGLFPWKSAGESVRLVIPISDEGPWCGDPVTQLDTDSVAHAITVAADSGVIVSPIVAGGASAAVLGLAQTIAAATSGKAFLSSAASADIVGGIFELVLDACAQGRRCVLGDIDCDGSVDGADLGVLLGAWGSQSPKADLNCDSVVDGADLGILLSAWSE